jgi:hypothetical protein
MLSTYALHVWPDAFDAQAWVAGMVEAARSAGVVS